MKQPTTIPQPINPYIMNRDLAYRLQLSLEQLRTQALDGIRALLEEANAHRVILNHNVILHCVSKNAYSETKEVYMTGQCFIVNSFGESELEELKYIPIASLLHILRLIEEGEVQEYNRYLNQ